MLKSLAEKEVAFWQRHPAALYGLFALLGSHAALHFSFLLIIPFVALALPFFFLQPFRFFAKAWMRFLFALFFLTMAFSIVKVFYRFPTAEELSHEVKGKAEFSISSLGSKESPFGPLWIYKGHLRSFIPKGEKLANSKSIAKGAPFFLQIAKGKVLQRPLANRNYLIEAQLKKESQGDSYALAIQLKDPWKAIEGTWSLAEWRFKAKQVVKNYLRQKIVHPHAADFLAGIATGEFDDQMMQREFGRFGLQHIMAISGFHFSIIAAILEALMRFWLSEKKRAFVLMNVLTGYFAFLGCSASIMRAWLMSCLLLFARLTNRHALSLNSLGIALLIISFIDPLLCQSIAFNLSFLSTAAILFFFPSVDLLLQHLWRKRVLSQAIEMNLLNQHGFLLLTFLRQAFALTLAVNAVSFPMVLYYFHQFPWISLLYNLFFPFLVSISILCLLLALLFDFFFPPLGWLIHECNSYYTQFVLNFTYQMPSAIDRTFAIESISSLTIILYLSFLLWVALLLRTHFHEQLKERQELVFL